MATTPPPCQPIDPAVTHTLSWQVGNFAINSDNRQIGFRQSPSYTDTIAKFTEFLESNQVTPLSGVISTDGILHPAQWSSKPPAIPNFKYAEYRLGLTSGVIYIYTTKPTGTYLEEIKFFNTENTKYYGASSEGNVIITPVVVNNNIYDSRFVLFVANSIPAYIFRAINKIEAKLASAYPQATRVLQAPPAPLVEDEIDLSGNTIGCNANFKLYIEYKGPDGEFTTTISPPGWRTWAGGTTVAETDWTLENKPPLNDTNHMLQYWGVSEQFIDFFFRRELPHPPKEGKYALLIQPILKGDYEDAGSNTPIPSGGISIPWGKDIDTPSESAKFWMHGDFTVFTKFTRFDSDETYLFTHQWEVKHLHLVATKIEIKTTPPVIPKITNLDFQIVITDQATPKHIGAYTLRINYTKQYAIENTRDHTNISDPASAYPTVDCTLDVPWGPYHFDYPPNPLPGYWELNVDGHTININTTTNDSSPKWGKGYKKENCFVYSVKIYYKSVGQYLPDDLEKIGSFTPEARLTIVYKGNNISRLGFFEEPLPNWVGSADEDKPDAIPENISTYYDTGKQISFKSGATYKEGSIEQDHEPTYGEGETLCLRIDYSEIGGPPFFWGWRVRPGWPSLGEEAY